MRFVLFTLFGIALASSAVGQIHQTETFSPVHLDDLPYKIDLIPYDLGETPVPSLHSFAKAQWAGKWLLIGGRTNGLHAFTQNGFANFPVAHQNRDIWVLDPVTKQSWQRSLQDEAANLSVEAVDSLAVTNNQFYQTDDRLYITGGYGYRTDDDFTTFDALTSIDIPGLMAWVQGGAGQASTHIQQIRDPLFRVTGGAMYEIEGRTQLVFGQDFQGAYTPFGNGEYTHQVRSFKIATEDGQLDVSDVFLSEPQDAYRRRDLNVVPIVRLTDGEIQPMLVALSGVFTENGGAWSVPVEIDVSGVPKMADPTRANTFRQPMNTYYSAKLGLFSETTGEMHNVLFGGISLHVYDRETQTLEQSNQLPFMNQLTSVVIDAEARYQQFLLPNEFPEFYDKESGKRLHFGTNAEFMLADGVQTYENGVIRMDRLTNPTTLGYLFGGIAADQPNRGNTAASGRIFQVTYSPRLIGDFNEDGDLNVDDIDQISYAIREQINDPRFDLDKSGIVDLADLHHMIQEEIETWFGDANLDGEFTSEDLVDIFTAGEYLDDRVLNSTWGTGDWNADGEFDDADIVTAFIDGGYQAGLRNSPAIPEPSTQRLALFAVCLLAGRFRLHRFQPSCFSRDRCFGHHRSYLS